MKTVEALKNCFSVNLASLKINKCDDEIVSILASNFINLEKLEISGKSSANNLWTLT